MSRTTLFLLVSLSFIFFMACSKQESEKSTGEKAASTVNEAADDASSAADETSSDTEAAGEALAKELEPLIQKALQAIKDGNLDEAEKNISSAEAKKGDAPPDLQKKIEDARTSLDTAKAAESATSGLPKLGE